MLGAASVANATANSDPAESGSAEPLEIRIQRIQERLGHVPGTEVTQDDVSSLNVRPMWWGNWQNSHPDTGNGGSNKGDWHKWHNWGNW
jgi:hypothetical protein